MERVDYCIFEDKLVIGESPRLVVDLHGGENYIETDDWRIPYQKEIRFSPDLLEGKRQNVMQTAVLYYYSRACRVVEDHKRLLLYYENVNELGGRLKGSEKKGDT